MTGPLHESDYIFGLYEPGGEHHMTEAGRTGWIVFSEAVGHDPDDRSGVDFSPFSDQGYGVICRINNGYEPDGTIPHSSQYEEFARRVANFVATSRGCKIWIIGNEMNYAAERPGIVIDWSRHRTKRTGAPDEADPNRRGVSVRFNALPDNSTEIRTTRGAIISAGEVITPELYARCYRLCRDAIHRVPGHADDQVLVGAVAPWNSQTIYGSNPNGDWVQYFRDILTTLGVDQCDGFALHAFTRGSDPDLITNDARLAVPFQAHHASFRTYMDFLAAVPPEMRTLPVYITEADQTQPWTDRQTGWVQQAYAEIDAWNQQPGNQLIRALVLYRWPRVDKWHIDGKQGVVDDFLRALENDYRWRKNQPAPLPAKRRSKPAPPPPDYQVEWINDQFPRRLVVNTTVQVPLEIRNTGSKVWSWGGGNPFRVGYHYYRNRRQLELASEFYLRTDVPDDVGPGETALIQAQVALPSEPGNYTLEFDLVHEGVTWFKEEGSPVLTRWLTVEPTELDATNSHDDGAGLPVPLFKDVIARLPHGGAGYARRSLDSIRYLVISHTGTHPGVGLDRMAQAHIKRGYPGIVYDFVVDGSGQVFRTSQLEDVAAPGQKWALEGVNICLAGDFTRQAPPLAQLDATGRLCAWLARNLNLGPDAIVGLNELTRSSSPGRSFHHGATWRETLRRQVQLHLAVLASGAEQSRGAEYDAELAQSTETARALREELLQVQAERTRLQRFAEQLQAELAEAQQQLTTVQEHDLQRPAIRNVVDTLPRDPARYMLRRAEAIRYVVINHTGAAPGVALQRLAEAHMPDWPGLLYDFVIDDSGVIFQTQPLEEVVDTGQTYLAQAINIAFAGEFQTTTPTNPQLHAGGRLIAWLMSRYPQLALDNIRGLSEFIEHPSPGEQWIAGAGWRAELLRAVRRAAGMVDPSETEERLQAALSEQAREVQLLRHNLSQLQEQRRRLQADNEQLQRRTAEQQEQATPYVVPQPPLRNVADQLPRHPTLRYERRPLSQITHIAVHHTATLPSIGPARIAELHVNADPARGKEAWPGIGYHYFVHADGTIEQTNAREAVSFHVFQHNHYTVGVAFAGSFMNGKIPTSAQLRAGAHLIAWLAQELNVPVARIWGHRDFPDNVTVCPGSEWTGGRRWRDQLFRQVDEIKRGMGIKSVRHYMLFWQRPYPGPLARQDFINAVGYVARFRPSLGFRTEDARNAEYVTIIGGEAGVSAATEQALRHSGCKVERIAGRNEEETGRMLTELARQGRRFRTFEVDF